MGGSFTSVSAWMASVDWVAVIGLILMICGFALQVAGAIRARDAERRDKEKHRAEMKLLLHKIEQFKKEE